MEILGGQNKILLVDDEQSIWEVFPRLFRAEGWNFTFAASTEEAIEKCRRQGVVDDLALAVVDIGLPGASGLELLRWLKGADADLPVVMLTALADARTAVTCMRAGASDFVGKPFEAPDLLQVLHRALEARRLSHPYAGPPIDEQLSQLMGSSDKIRQLTKNLMQVSPTDMSILVEGESGTGKEILARRIHELSRRSNGPFVAVDCGAIPENLIESELFGFKKGSFTGAVSDQEGKIRAAAGGTLFLDEVENLAPAIQVKLLRVLQEREVTPIGSTRPVPVDIRLVGATNVSLGEKIAKNEFRLDLFHRIAEFPLAIPPIRERPDDVLYLAMKFLREACIEFGKRVEPPGHAIVGELLRYHWPGNVRELRNVIRRAVLVSQGRIETLGFGVGHTGICRGANVIHTDDQWLIYAQAVVSADTIDQGKVPFKQIRDRVVGEIERGILSAVLEHLAGNKLQASRVLGLDYKTVHTKAKTMTEGRSSGGKTEQEP